MLHRHQGGEGTPGGGAIVDVVVDADDADANDRQHRQWRHGDRNDCFTESSATATTAAATATTATTATPAANYPLSPNATLLNVILMTYFAKPHESSKEELNVYQAYHYKKLTL